MPHEPAQDPKTTFDQSNQTVIGPQFNIAGNVLDARGIYANLTVQALLNACQAQVQGVLNDVRFKYDPTLYVHRAIEAELNDFFDQPLADPNRNCYLIIAPAGSGKTNLLCDLARARVRQQPVVLILGGSAYLSGAAGLLGTLQSELEAAMPDVSFRSASDSLHMLSQLADVLNQDVLLFVDAINEHDQPAQMRKAVAELLRLTRNKRVKLVITCRDFYWNLFKGSFWTEATVNAAPTDGTNEEEQEDEQEDGQADFYRFAATEQTQALTLYLHHYAIKGQPIGAALEQCRHPLLLRFFCEAYRGQEIGEIEDIRLKELFDRYWEQKLLSIAERRLQQGEERLQDGLINEVATYLLNVASFMLHHNERSVLLTQLHQATSITEETSNPRSIYGRIRDEFIILEEQERGKGKRKTLQIAFVYEEFMEYVMARALLQAWDEKGLDDAAILAELDKLMQSYQHFAQILGVMVYLAIMLKENRNLAFWSFLINSGETWRNVVFEAFKKLPADQLDNGVYTALFDMLTQNDPNLQAQVLDLFKLKRIGRGIITYEALLTTVRELAVQSDVRLARRATLALQYSADARLIPLCIQNLRHKRSEVRNNAIKLLANIGKETVEPLIKALNHMDHRVRQGAIIALGRLGDSRAVEPLIIALNDEHEKVRESAIAALRQLGEAQTVAILIAARNNEDEAVRESAIAALAQLGDAWAVEPLIAALNNEDEAVRESAIAALAQSGDVRAVEPLIAALNDEHKAVRESAIAALAQMGDVRAVEPLIAAHDHKLVDDQPLAKALARFQQQTLQALESRLTDPDMAVRQRAQPLLQLIEIERAYRAMWL